MKSAMGNKKPKNTKKAFKWIVGILRKYKIPFQITGGLAARVYGAKRPLLDIDIDVPNDRLKELLPDFKNNIILGPVRDKTEGCDVFFIRLNYNGQQIDISGGTDAKIYDHKEKKWVDSPTDFENFEEHVIFGIKVPVINRKDLIAYKSILGRDVDLEDLNYLINGI